MFLRVISARIGVSILAVLVCASAARGQITQKPGFFGQIPRGTLFQCPDGRFLVGLTERKTDRLVGLTFACVGTGLGPTWKSLDLTPP
jgi:hypothetical protein